MHRLLPGGGHIFHQRQRGPVDGGQLGQQRIPDGRRLSIVAAQHDELDAGGAQHFAVSRGQLLRGQAVHLFQIALLPHGGGAVAEKFPVGLPQAVDALVVHFIFQCLFQHLLFDLHGLRVEHAAHEGRVESRPQRNGGIFTGQGLPFQRKPILDAGHADAQVVVAAHGAGVHGQVCAVQLCQLLGQQGHVRAVGVAALQHQRQQGVGGGRGPLCREGKMDADAAAVEFFRRVAGKMHARRNESTFQFQFLRLRARARNVLFAKLTGPSVRPGIPPGSGRWHGWPGRFPPPHTASATARTPPR